MNETANSTGKFPEILPDIINNEDDAQIRNLVSGYSNDPLFKHKVELAVKFIRERIQTIQLGEPLKHDSLLNEILNFSYPDDSITLGHNIYDKDTPGEYKTMGPMISQTVMDGTAIFYAIVFCSKEMSDKDKLPKSFVATSESTDSTYESIESELIAALAQVKKTLTEFMINNLEQNMSNANYDAAKKNLNSDTTEEGDENALNTRQKYTPLN